MGNVLYSEDSVGNVKEYTYDEFGRVLSEKTYAKSEPNKTQTERKYFYDLYGNVKFEIDENNVVTKHEYDQLGRLTRSVVENVTVVDPDT